MDTRGTLEVHVFVNHLPTVACVFLPKTYSGFSPARFDSLSDAQETPQSTPTWPPDLRNKVAHYILPTPYPRSTPISAISKIIARDYHISEDLQAHFSIWSQFFYVEDEDYLYIQWAKKPLPPETALAEAWSYDCCDAGRLSNRIDLVLHTTAAALSQVTGVEFLGGLQINWGVLERRFEAYHRGIAEDSAELEFLKQLKRWRFSTYGLSYLRSLEARQSQTREEDGRSLSEMEKIRQEAQQAIERLVTCWEVYVEEKELGLSGAHLMEKGVEEAYQIIRKKKWETARKWKIEEGEEGKDTSGTQEATEFSADKPVQADRIASESSTQTGKLTRTRSLKCNQGNLNQDADGFMVRSGILAWGQSLPIYYGLSLPLTSLTGNASTVPPMLPGGTIRQHRYTYKSAARNGHWKVRRAYTNSTGGPVPDGEPDRHFGWVFAHEDIDPLEVLKRCRVINSGYGGISNGNGHVDKDVLYIGRYDWSYTWSHPEDRDFPATFQSFVREALELPEDTPPPGEDDPQDPTNSSHQYFMAFDPALFQPDFVKALKSDCPILGYGARNRPPVERLFVKDDAKFGAYVSRSGTEYEFAWLLFSTKKHDVYPEADELIAIIYDASYEGLEGSEHAVESSSRQRFARG